MIIQSPDTMQRVTLILQLSKSFLTHLDQSHFVADRLPLEIFDDFLGENERLKKLIDKRKVDKQPELHARSYYFHLDGTVEEKDAVVLEYDSERKKFLIQFESQGKIL